MERHFHDEIKILKKKLLDMGFLVAETIEKSTRALLTRDTLLVQEVMEQEKTINRLEIEIDQQGHQLSALWQPMAGDLRLITSVLKINTDFERLGDHAVNIAERTVLILEEPHLEAAVQLPEMVRAVNQVLSDALLSLKFEDVDLARRVLMRDDEVDNYNDQLYQQLEGMMERDPNITRAGINLIMIGHNLERIADLANNIAEDVIYMKQGREVRHHTEEKK